MTADPVVSPADTPEELILRARIAAEAFPGSKVSRTLAELADLAAALLAVGERDRQQIARLTEALEQIIRVAVEPLDSMTPVKPELRRRGQLMLDIARAVLAGEEDAANG